MRENMSDIERERRELEEITSLEKRVALFSHFLMNTEIQVREGKKPVHIAKVVGFNEQGSQTELEIRNCVYNLGTRLNGMKFVGRYIQFEGIIEQIKPGNIYVLKIEKILMAKQSRASTRITPQKDTVYATHLKITKSAAELDSFNLPTFVKIAFQEYENKLIQSKQYEYVKISPFTVGMSEKFFSVKQSGKTYYVKNTYDLNSYKTDNPEEFIDFEEDILDEPKSLIQRYKLEKIISEMIMPIIFVNPGIEGLVIGYIHIQGKTRYIEPDQVMDVKLLSLELIDRIRESFTLSYTNKIEIMNLSEKGLRIKVFDNELIEQIKIAEGFTLDIVFKMQAPIQTSVLIRNTSKTPDGGLGVGLEIEGFRKGDKERYLDNLRVLTRPSRN